MVKVREIKRIVTGTRAVDGAGVNLVRVFGKPDVRDFDPFLMLDAFDSTDPEDYVKGFPWHPHRGIETITYLITGLIEHGDSLGNSGKIEDGCCQWMTAGSGIIHQEMPRPSSRMLGAQLWLNLPASDKMTGPKYNDIASDLVPEVRDGRSAVKVISGLYAGTRGAMEAEHVKVTYLDVELEKGAVWSTGTDPADTVFIHLVQGGGRTGSIHSEVFAGQAALMGEGSAFMLEAGGEGARFLFLEGRPLGEPIAWGGPIVMNTEEELRRAFKELDEDTFIRHARN